VGVIPRPLLVVFVYALPILVVTFGVILGASALAAAMGDAPGGRTLGWIAVGALILLAIDALLLLGALGMQALHPDQTDEEPPE
jgi:hypothetical protein